MLVLNNWYDFQICLFFVILCSEMKCAYFYVDRQRAKTNARNDERRAQSFILWGCYASRGRSSRRDRKEALEIKRASISAFNTLQQR